MKTVNIPLENSYFDRKKALPVGYTWQRIIDLGLKDALRLEQKILYWQIQEDVKRKNPGAKLGLVKLS